MDTRKPVTLTAMAMIAGLCAVIGTQNTAIKLAAGDMAPVLQVGLRSSLAAMAVFAIVLASGHRRALFSANWRAGVIARALFGIEFVLVGQGLKLTSAAHMTIFLYTAPIFAALCLHFQYREERLAPLQWGGIGLATMGVVVAFAGSGQSAVDDRAWLGDLLGMAAGLAFGATTLVIRGSRLASAPSTVTLWYQLAGGGVICIGAAFLLGETAVTVTPALIANLSWQAFGFSTLALIGWFAAMRTYLVSRISILSLMTPMFGVLFGVIVLGDQLTPDFIAGAALMALGLLLVGGHDALRMSLRRHGRATPSAMTPDHSCGQP